MPVNRVVNSTPSTFSISEPFKRIEKKSGNEIIITDWTIPISGPEYSELILNKRLLWFKVVNGAITILNSEPNTLPATMFEHGNWELSRLVLKGANLHYMRYSDASKDQDHRVEVVSYEPSDNANDEMTVFINQTENMCQVYFD